MNIGYLGPKGTFSQKAAEVYLNNISLMDVVLIAYENITDLIIAVNQGELDEAVVPIENSMEGSVNITLDMLAWEVDLKIKKEIVLPIIHNIMAKDFNEDFSLILSHPQAIGQCRYFLHKYYSDVPIKYTYSTAQAAEKVSQSEEKWAAIAGEKAAQEYGLNIIKTSIQDNINNVTRFIVLSRKDSEKTGKDKTSIIFSTEDKPGSLYRILQILDLWNINMSRIESRPTKNSLGKYIFFVDINGHHKDEDLNDALTMIRRKTSFFKLLGSYQLIE